MVQMIFRELWAKGASKKRICSHAVQITRGEEVDDEECFISQRWKQQWNESSGNITITNPTVRRAYNKTSRRLARIQ